MNLSPELTREELVSSLETELKNLDEEQYPQIKRLVESELFRIRGGIGEWVDVVNQKKVKIRTKVTIPVDQYPRCNFVGKLLGPKGSTLQRIQEETLTKMAILGQGSMRNGEKEQELLNSGDPKYSHLKNRMHLQIDSLGLPSEAYYRLSHALSEVSKVMTPDEESMSGWGDQYGGAPMGMSNHRPGGRGRGRGGGGRGGRGRGGGGGGYSNGGSGGYDNSGSSYPQTYESFGAFGDQTPPTGKFRGGGRGRGGRGRGHPYSRGNH